MDTEYELALARMTDPHDSDDDILLDLDDDTAIEPTQPDLDE